MGIVFSADPTRQFYTVEEVQKAIAAQQPREALLSVLQRLHRTGQLPRLTPKEPENRIVSAAAVNALVHHYGYLCGEGVVKEVEDAVKRLLQMSVSIAKANHRKTVKPGDVNGTSGDWALALKRK